MRIARYGKTRYWAVYDGATLVCVCLYKKGAAEVLTRLQQMPSPLAPPPGVFPARRLREDAARSALSRLARVLFARHP